jgi:glutathione S-transferase
VPINIRAGDNRTAAYLAINPSGAVPTLRVGETSVTESHAILAYVADQVPERALIPPAGSLARAQAHEWMNFISSSIHPAFRSIFRPEVYAGNDPAAIEAVRVQATSKLGAALLEVERRLGAAPFALGEFSVVDAYLFVFYLWSFDERVQTTLPARPAYAALADRVWQRPAVRKVVARERAVRAYDMPPEFLVDADASR